MDRRAQRQRGTNAVLLFGPARNTTKMDLQPLPELSMRITSTHFHSIGGSADELAAAGCQGGGWFSLVFRALFLTQGLAVELERRGYGSIGEAP
jgi:hypothetical protein